MTDSKIGGLHAGGIGEGEGRDIMTLSSAVKRLQIQATKDLKLAETVKAILQA